MNYLQEVNILFQKRIDYLQKKKERCFIDSFTPNRCVAKIEAQIKRLRDLAKLAKMRTQRESKSLVNAYLTLLDERGPSSPVAKVATLAVGSLGAYKAAKWAIMRDRCKEYRYSPYLYKRCMKGQDE